MSQEFDDKPLPLAVAAALAYNRLYNPDVPRFYDAEHFSDTLTMTAGALIRVAKVYVEESGARRPLAAAELEGAEVRRGATLLVLADGRELAEVTMRRGDLRDAVAALKVAALGAALQELKSRSNSFRTTS